MTASTDSVVPEAGRELTLMEICGTHTVSIFKSGIRSLLPPRIRLISGPGCPVCVTPTTYMDQAIQLAETTDVVVMSFGDMLRVPGSNQSLLDVRRNQPGAVRIIYSPLEAVDFADLHPEVQVVFLGVGFETTAPTVAAAVLTAREKNLKNFSVLCACKTIPEAMAALLSTGDITLDGFILPGHVSAVIGVDAYRLVLEKFQIPAVVCSFEPRSLFTGIAQLIQLADEGRTSIENAYTAVVRNHGNPAARSILAEVFQPCDTAWRGLGIIPGTGLELRSTYQDFDALQRFPELRAISASSPSACRCGDVLTGRISPPECPLFGKACTPARPIGPCMVSSEGTCGAWLRYHVSPTDQHPACIASGNEDQPCQTIM